MSKVASCVATVALLSACATTSVSRYEPLDGQETITRDGVPVVMSAKSKSIVMLRQAKRERTAGERPAYVLAILNVGAEPLDFAFSNVRVTGTTTAGQAIALKTFSYDDLVREERNRQVATAILVGLAAGANAAAAANSGTYSGSGTVSGPYGTSTVSFTGYDPAAASLASARASAENQAMVASAAATGRRNLDALEGSIIKDNTIFVGEWYGGEVHFERPRGSPPFRYSIELSLGGEVHRFNVVEEQQSN